MSMKDNFFAPLTLTVAAGQQVTVVAKNDGKDLHNWAIVNPNDPAGTHPESPLLAPGKQAEITFSFDQPGTYTYHCDVHITQNMVGTLIVQ
jgi:plastocyanin